MPLLLQPMLLHLLLLVRRGGKARYILTADFQVDISPVYKFEPQSLCITQPLFPDDILAFIARPKETFLSVIGAMPALIRPGTWKSGGKRFGKLSRLDGEDDSNGFVEVYNNKTQSIESRRSIPRFRQLTSPPVKDRRHLYVSCCISWCLDNG
jgi:hypothetical protein